MDFLISEEPHDSLWTCKRCSTSTNDLQGGISTEANGAVKWCNACMRELFDLSELTEHDLKEYLLVLSNDANASHSRNAIDIAILQRFYRHADELATTMGERVYCRHRGEEGKESEEDCGVFLGRRAGIAIARICGKCEGCTCLCCWAMLDGGDSFPHVCDPAVVSDLVEREIDASRRGRDWQVCPNPDCGLMVEARGENYPCAAMPCPRCATEFCFSCGIAAREEEGHLHAGEECPQWIVHISVNSMFHDSDDERFRIDEESDMDESWRAVPVTGRVGMHALDQEIEATQSWWQDGRERTGVERVHIHSRAPLDHLLRVWNHAGKGLDPVRVSTIYQDGPPPRNDQRDTQVLSEDGAESVCSANTVERGIADEERNIRLGLAGLSLSKTPASGDGDVAWQACYFCNQPWSECGCGTPRKGRTVQRTPGTPRGRSCSCADCISERARYLVLTAGGEK